MTAQAACLLAFLVAAVGSWLYCRIRIRNALAALTPVRANLAARMNGDSFTRQRGNAPVHRMEMTTAAPADDELRSLNFELRDINDDLRELREMLLAEIREHPPKVDPKSREEGLPNGNALIQQFLYRHHWHDWMAENAAPLSTPHRPPSLQELWDQDLPARQGSPSSQPERLGMYKFTPDGECITLPSQTPLAAVAFELEKLLALEIPAHPLDPDAG